MDIVENIIEYGYTKVDDDFVRFVVVEQILDNNRVRTRYTGGLTEKYEDQIIQIEAEIQHKKDFRAIMEFQKETPKEDSSFVDKRNFEEFKKTATEVQLDNKITDVGKNVFGVDDLTKSGFGG